MKVVKLIVVCLFCLVAIAPPAWSQNQPIKQDQPSKQEQGVPGFLDPKTGTFTTKARSSASQAAVGTTTILARLIFNFTILNDQPGGNTTVCSVSISPTDAAGFYSEEASSTATGGGTACSVTLLFSWDLATPSSDMVNITYSISSAGSGQSRASSHSLPSIPMLTNFETLTVPTISATI
jgi:hypothetical protein